MELERRSSGVAKAGLTTGIIGTALGVLNGGAGLMNGYGLGRSNYAATPYGAPVVASVAEGGGYLSGCCSEDHFVNRYEMEAEQKLAAKDSEIALLKAGQETDTKMLELYKYIDGKFIGFEQQFGQQAVQNQATQDSFQMLQDRIQCCHNEIEAEIANERHERRCADNTIVTYANATFYPKMIANVTTGTTTTAQVLYNPLPVDTCDCNVGCGC